MRVGDRPKDSGQRPSLLRFSGDEVGMCTAVVVIAGGG